MSWLSRLFGGKSGAGESAEAAPGPQPRAEDYKGFAVLPRPIREGGQYRVAARIEKDGRVHQMIRADTMTSEEEATAISLSKARQMIDQMGERLFGD